jgi:multicomponent Na+:H+ antiporter subunit B
MQSIILRTASNYLLPLLLLFAVFLLLRGHYLPGGGFIGGLVASIAFVLHAFANGLADTRHLLRIHPGYFMPFGLALSFLAGVMPMFNADLPFMTGLWKAEPVAVVGMLGTALLFDTGVFFVVIGSALTILFTISETA